ncbi:MAG: helix-turn-helix transcriptional regulator [Nitrospinales bacterium]
MEKPLFRSLFWLAGFLLLAWGAGCVAFFLGARGGDGGNLKAIGITLAWLVCVVVWGFVHKLRRSFLEIYRFRQKRTDIDVKRLRKFRYPPLERSGFLPEKWSKGYKALFNDEFTRWGLTKAEKEVGALLLTGMSQKEIARLRRTSLKTVKNQTTVVYEKIQVKNGRELMSYFIQLLLPPLEEESNPQIPMSG